MLFFKDFLSFFVNSINFAIFKCRAKGRLVNKILLARNEHVIDIFTSEDMENILLCISRYLTAYYIINRDAGTTGAVGAVAPIAFCLHSVMGALRVYRNFKPNRFDRNKIPM